ncbi:hypothetical protein FY112_27760 [Rhizobium sp. PEPV16]|nr:hypothetical protein FY112_27760 [Rhizobium sp. PEPV16]
MYTITVTDNYKGGLCEDSEGTVIHDYQLASGKEVIFEVWTNQDVVGSVTVKANEVKSKDEHYVVPEEFDSKNKIYYPKEIKVDPAKVMKEVDTLAGRVDHLEKTLLPK